MGKNSHSKHIKTPPPAKPSVRTVMRENFESSAHSLIHQECVTDGRDETVIYPLIASGQFSAGDASDIQGLLQIVKGRVMKVFVAKTIREITISGKKYSVQYFISYLPTSGSKGTWEEPSDDFELECIDNKGFSGMLPVTLTGTMYCSPSDYFCLALVKKQ